MKGLIVPLLLVVWTSRFAAQVETSRCGNTEVFGKSLKSYVFGEDSNEVFPWNVLIATKIRGSVKCLGSVIDTEKGPSNHSNFIVTAAHCFRLKKRPATAEFSTRIVYIAPTKFSSLNRQGVKREIESVLIFGYSYNASKLQDGLAILKLKHAVSPKLGIIPVCLAPRGALPTMASLCFSTQFDRKKKRIVQTVVTLYYRKRCLQSQNKSMSQGSGICAYEERQERILQLGGAMICFDKNQAVLYGVFLRNISLLEYLSESEVSLYEETATIHEALSKVRTPSSSIKLRLRPTQSTPSLSESRPDEKSSSSSQSSSSFSSQNEVIPKRTTAPAKPPRKSKMVKPSQTPLPTLDYPVSHKICSHGKTEKLNGTFVDSTQNSHILNGTWENGCLPAAPIVQIVDLSDTSPEKGCTGILYVRPKESYSDTVLTFARCVWSRYTQKYKVYVGTAMTTEHAAKIRKDIKSSSMAVPVKSILTFPLYLRLGIVHLSAAGAAIVKLEHSISLITSLKPYSLSYPWESANPGMSCYVIGISGHHNVTRVAYNLLPQNECARRLNYEYYPNFQYCGVGRGKDLFNVTGAPLVCNIHRKWKQVAFYDQVASHANTTGIPQDNTLVLFMKLGDLESKIDQTESFAKPNYYTKSRETYPAGLFNE